MKTCVQMHWIAILALVIAQVTPGYATWTWTLGQPTGTYESDVAEIGAHGMTNRPMGTAFTVKAQDVNDNFAVISSPSGSSESASWHEDLPAPGSGWPVGTDSVKVILIPNDVSDTVTPAHRLITIVNP